MSDDDVQSDYNGLKTKLRACEACKARKIRCDKLAPCSSCKSAGIPCRSAKRHQEKRQRVLISNRYEEQLERINAQLEELQAMIKDVSRAAAISCPPEASKPHIGPTIELDASSRNGTSREAMFLGESSFEMHSQQTTQALEIVLNNSPVSIVDRETTSALQHLRGLLRQDKVLASKTFTNDLPMPSTQLALKALRMAEQARTGFFLSAPMLDYARYKEICQKVYFPVNDYTAADFITANGGLFTILSDVPDEDMKRSGIDPEEAREAVKLCERNVFDTIERLSVFLEPTTGNIEALMVGAQIAISRSRPHAAWQLTSMSARMCLDSGLHRYKPLAGDAENNVKRLLFWYTYALDKGLSLNFGRAPTFSDLDITIDYPEFPADGMHALGLVWLELARIQGRIYDNLYSAQGQRETQERRTALATTLYGELERLRIDLKSILNRFSTNMGITTELESPCLDTEMMILGNMSLVYRCLPTPVPHPLAFAPECIAISREALQSHRRLCARLHGRMDSSFRMYIDWNLLFSPFTPFLVILGTAIINNDLEDLELLFQVVESLKDAGQRSSGGKRLYEICKHLYKGAKTCIQQSASNISKGFVSTTTAMDTPAQIFTTHDLGGELGDGSDTGSWPSFPVGSADDMSSLFDHYLVGNSTMLGFFEGDLGGP